MTAAGTTEDDLARESISALLGETMQVDPKLKAELRGMFAVVMPGCGTQCQASYVDPSAEALPNPRGTVPGWWVEKISISLLPCRVCQERCTVCGNRSNSRLKPYTGG